MVRVYKKNPGTRNYQNYSQESMQLAVAAYRRGDGSLMAMPLKGAWRKVLIDWKKHDKGVIRKDHFPRFLKKALNNIETTRECFIRSGFEATGIVPLCRDKILARLLKENVSHNEAEERMAASLKDIFREQRFGRAGPPIEKKKKLKVEAGKSVTEENIAPLSNIIARASGTSRVNDVKKVEKKKKKKNRSKLDSSSSESGGHMQMELDDITDISESFSDLEEEMKVLEDRKQTEGTFNEIETETGEIINTEGEKTEADNENLEVDDFVLVALKTKAGGTKQFVAQIIEQVGKSFICSFLRESNKIANSFIFPVIEDNSIIDAHEIIKKLKKPNRLRRGQLKFD